MKLSPKMDFCPSLAGWFISARGGQVSRQSRSLNHRNTIVFRGFKSSAQRRDWACGGVLRPLLRAEPAVGGHGLRLRRQVGADQGILLDGLDDLVGIVDAGAVDTVGCVRCITIFTCWTSFAGRRGAPDVERGLTFHNQAA